MPPAKRKHSRKPGASKAEVVSQAPGQIIEGEAKEVSEDPTIKQPLTAEEGGQTQAEAEQGSTESPAEQGATEDAEEGAKAEAESPSGEAKAEESPTRGEGQSEAAAPASSPAREWPITLKNGTQIFADTPTRCMTCGATFHAVDAPDGTCPAFDAAKGTACGGSMAPVGG